MSAPGASSAAVLEAARQASLAGHHQQAVDLCVSVLRQHPGEPHALAFLALALWRASAFAQAVDVLQQALKHFPAQEELSLALLDAWLALGQGEQAMQFAAGLPQALLARPAFRSRIEDRLVRLLNAGAFEQCEQELLPLMQAQPDWALARSLRLALRFHGSGGGVSAHALTQAGTAAERGAAWRRELADAMSSHRRHLLASVAQALAAAPADKRLLELQARLRFESGDRLGAADLPQLQRWLGSALHGPFPLRSAQDSGPAATVDILEPARLLDIPAPRCVGGALQLEGAIGPAITSDRYVAQARRATACAGSDVVLLETGDAWCDSLTHPLGELTGPYSDSWMALASVQQVLLRDAPVLHVEGTAWSLLGSTARFYGHWLLDYLLRLRALEHLPQVLPVQVLVEDDMPSSHYQALALLLGDRAPLRRVPRGQAVQVDRLVWAGPDVYFPHATRVGAPNLASVSPASVDGMARLRQRVLDALPAPTERRGGRLLVRRRSLTRRVQNEDALRDLLVAEWGFEELHPETLDFADQVRRFQGADVIVGAQGSAMSNAVFCAPGSVVVSLCSSFAANFPAWAHALEQLGVRHCFVVGEAQPGSHALPLQRDIRVEPDAVREALRLLGVEPTGHGR
ncbi:MAG: glycosyltransferase family 61 protein [Burkholderiales bacterium]|nr:MAG: glycosyltransferase family 61 protein [Burkholderiales bacterium]